MPTNAANPKSRKMSRRERLRALAQNMLQRRRAGKTASPVVHPDTFKPYPVTYRYGVKNNRYAAGHHTGEDYACPVGSLALATGWGRVVYAGPGANCWGPAYGNQVVIRTNNGRYDYAHNHLSKVTVKAGDGVGPGYVVGYTGATGNVTGPHSHFEARRASGRYGSDVHPSKVRVNVS